MDERLLRLYGDENLKKIENTKVCIIGIGGVGGFALESLVRSKVGHITVIDPDLFQESNLNRQILSDNTNIGEYKVDIAIKRATAINKEISINGLNIKIDGSNVHLLKEFDYIIDACDDISAKVEIIKFATSNNIKIISCLGTGKKINPSLVEITKLNKTINDPLAKKLRYLLKKDNVPLNIPVVFSSEIPINNDTVIASSIFVPGVAGLYLGSYVINDIIKK